MDTNLQHFAFSDLSKAPEEILSGYKNLDPMPVDRRCKRCGTVMDSPGVVISDAGQAFEVVDHNLLQTYHSKLNEIAKARGQPNAISVLKQTKACVELGGSICQKYVDRVVFTRETLTQFVKAVLLMRFYRLSFFTAVQLSGIPTGGPWGPVALALLFGFFEHEFRTKRWKSFAKLWGLPKRITKALFFGRYEDDLIGISNLLCASCVSKLKDLMYGTVAKFDDDEKAIKWDPQHTTLLSKYLDLRLVFRSGNLSIFPNIGNLEAICKSDVRLIVKPVSYTHLTLPTKA